MLEEERVKVASFPNFDKKRRLETTSRSSLGMEKGGETKKTFQGGRVIHQKRGNWRGKERLGKRKLFVWTNILENIRIPKLSKRENE